MRKVINFMSALWYVAVTLLYMLAAGVGVLLSYPLTIILIAWESAQHNKEKIRQHLDPNP